MSQFLLCRTDKDLSKYGTNISYNVLNKDLLDKVKQMYFPNDLDEKIWSIEKIHDIINDYFINKNIIYDIFNLSDEMIFWYGSDYLELDVIDSYDDFCNIIKKNLEDNSYELYLRVINNKY